MSLAVAEEIIDDHADNGEEEDDERPDDLVGGGAVRLEDLDPGNDIEDKDDESDNSTSSSSLPGLSRLSGNRRRLCEHEERELEEHGDDKAEHSGGYELVKSLEGSLWAFFVCYREER